MATNDFYDWCREKGGDIVEKGDKVACEVEASIGNDPTSTGGGSVREYSREWGSRVTERAIRSTPGIEFSLYTIVLITIGLGITALTKAWAISAVLAGQTGTISGDVLLGMFLPVVSMVFVDLPMWAWYAIAFSWLGIIAALGIILVSFFDWGRGIGALAGVGFLFYAVVNAIGAAVWSGALTLVAAEQTLLTFAKIYVLARLGLFGIPIPFLAEGVFAFSQVLWLAIVVWWMIQGAYYTSN